MYTFVYIISSSVTMKRNIFFITIALGSIFLTGCSKVNDKEEIVEEMVDQEAVEKEKKIQEALSSYKKGEYPLYIDGIVLVNKDYGIPDDFATDLNSELLEQFEIMKSDAKKAGLDINIRSGFRTMETQEMLFNNYAKKDGIEKANRYSAVPGYSEHQTGLAVDISNGDYSTSIGDWFTETPQTKWLYENAHKYGFILRYPQGKEHITGYKYESWHYRYVGVYHSQHFNQNNLTLEEYLGVK